MNPVARLKDEARRHEQAEQWERAIDAYEAILRIGDSSEARPSLYNRVGDLYVRLGLPLDAVDYYEKAADYYAGARLYNNAIAFCNKALRHGPNQLELLRKLAQFFTAQGFNTDARQCLLEYADRKLKRDELDEALSALEELAARHEEDAEIRARLGRVLRAQNRPGPAVAALRHAQELFQQEGDASAAEAVRAEILQLAAEAFAAAEVERLSAAGRVLALAPGPEPTAGILLTTDPPDDAGYEQPLSADPPPVADLLAVPLETSHERDQIEQEAIPVENVARDRTKREYIDLLNLVSDDEDDGPNTRFSVSEQTSGDEDRDFADLLHQFKQKIAENLSVEDTDAHYDLGLAFKEMGLVDEAIAQFQIALKGGSDRLKVCEELGNCFMLKEQYGVAVNVLRRALQLKVADEGDLLGVYYTLARAHEELGQASEARAAYERVIGLDIKFRDASQRLTNL
jgi:tetratricopeptide (TPR) repeat protein